MDTNTEKDKVQETSEETIARLTKEKKTLTSSNLELSNKYEALLKSSGEEVQRLSAALDAAKRVADEHEPTITVAKQDYIVHGKVFTWKNEEYTVAQLLTNSQLQKELVEAGVGFLQKK